MSFCLPLICCPTHRDSGSHQILHDRLEREHPHIARKISYGNLAGHLVSGVQERQAAAKGARYNTGRKDGGIVTLRGRMNEL